MTLRCFLLQRTAAALWPATLHIIGFVLQPLNHFLIPFFMASGVLVPRYSYVAQTCGAPPRRHYYLTGYSLTFSLLFHAVRSSARTPWVTSHSGLQLLLLLSLLKVYLPLTCEEISKRTVRNKVCGNVLHANLIRAHCRDGMNLNCYFSLCVCACVHVCAALFRLTTPVRKFSQNLNAGRKSASHGWIIEEHPM